MAIITPDYLSTLRHVRLDKLESLTEKMRLEIGTILEEALVNGNRLLNYTIKISKDEYAVDISRAAISNIMRELKFLPDTNLTICNENLGPAYYYHINTSLDKMFNFEYFKGRHRRCNNCWCEYGHKGEDCKCLDCEHHAGETVDSNNSDDE
jgi:hypothetical protein